MVQYQAPKRGVNNLLGNLMDNYASNPDDSEQESADKRRVMSPFPASGSWLEGEERPVTGKDQRSGSIVLSLHSRLSVGIITSNALIPFSQSLVLLGLDEGFLSQQSTCLRSSQATGFDLGSSDPPLSLKRQSGLAHRSPGR